MSIRKIIRRPRVKELSGLSTSTIDRHEKAGHFPQRVRLGMNSIGWYEDEVLEWVASRTRGGVNPPEKAVMVNPKLGFSGLGKPPMGKEEYAMR